ncbi:estrogen receptor-related receptor [Elysia marginata]|uniref:Estrogen receptor-related receptor n=1 Tax=Elysia marginata TaxID=1093978 RepID=A0AAV4H3X9_9GAST|nr:estrogen receptor-related receptor [Elysia marginata]
MRILVAAGMINGERCFRCGLWRSDWPSHLVPACPGLSLSRPIRGPRSCEIFWSQHDIVAEVGECVGHLQDQLQDALSDCVKAVYGPSTRRLGQLFLLLPPITHIKLLAKQFWYDMKKDGRVMMHKLFLEMLDADS